MKEIKEMIRTYIIIFAKFFLHIFWIFPVNKKRIVFSCYKGSQYSCSPKYIYLKMKELYGDKYEFVWILNDSHDDAALNGVKIVKFFSLKYFFYICTCGVYINNVFFEPYIPKRKKQLLINTWHGGGAYKGNDDKRKTSRSMLIKDRMRDKITDYYISSCEAFTKSWCSEFSFAQNKYLPIGLPRNDLLINEVNNYEKRESIKTKIGIDNNTRIVLYAPTWRFLKRGLSECFTLDFNIEQLICHLEKKYDAKFVFLFRGHHCMKDVLVNENNKGVFVDVSNYPDMQELLLVTDFLINDYSSSIWDFALTKRPGVLYTPDLIEYEQKQHFLTPIDTWQYKHAETFEELLTVIDSITDKESIEKIDCHLRNLGSFEDGNASLKVCKIIDEHVGAK